MEKSFYGIDLGTTYSCISSIDDDGIVQVIINPNGQNTTPSVVAFDEKGKLLVGKAAKAQLGSKPDDTVAFIKREMSNGNFSRKIQGKSYNPVDISSFILKYLVEFANKKRKDEEDLDPIFDVVITVPAYFGMEERARTEEAGKQAGLNVLQLVNEPTAAALWHGKKQQANRTMMVYDLGGGTFDVSIMKVENGIINTMSTTGDHQLGGADWDRVIVDYVLEEVGSTFEQLSAQEQGMLLIAAEECKQTLTEQDKTTLTFSHKGIKNIEVTRATFDSRAAALMDRTMFLVDEALDLAKLSESDIDEIVLVGGSIRMPMVLEQVKKKFPSVDPKKVEPDLAIAKGAAITAIQSEKGYNPAGGLVFGMDKGSKAYGMEANSAEHGRMMIFTLIGRNDDMEITREFDNFSTFSEGQSAVNFKFYQYDSDAEVIEVDEKLRLEGRRDEINWGRGVAKNTPIRLKINRDKNGVIKVFAECQGATGEFVINVKGVNS